MSEQSSEIAVSDVGAVEQAIATGTVPELVSDPLEIQRAIFARLANAATVDEILEQGSGLDSWANDLEGIAVEVHGVRFNVSTYEQGAPVYAVVDLAVLEGERAGERLLVSCGGVNVMGQLVGMLKLGAFPAQVRIAHAEKPTRQGYRPLWLQAAYSGSAGKK